MTFAVSLVRKCYLFLSMKQQGSTKSPERCQNSSSLATSAVTWVERDGVPNSLFMQFTEAASHQHPVQLAQPSNSSTHLPSMNVSEGLHPGATQEEYPVQLELASDLLNSN